MVTTMAAMTTVAIRRRRVFPLSLARLIWAPRPRVV